MVHGRVKHGMEFQNVSTEKSPGLYWEPVALAMQLARTRSGWNGKPENRFENESARNETGSAGNLAGSGALQARPELDYQPPASQQMPPPAVTQYPSQPTAPRIPGVPQPNVSAPYPTQPQAPAYAQPPQEAPAAPILRPIIPKDNTLPYCPQCNAPLEANARFCGECGLHLQVRIQACPGCSLPLEPNAKFCGECGYSLK